MNIEQLLQDYNIPYVVDGHKHSTRGWVNTHCPFCTGSQDFHLGIHIESGVSHCWRCGPHNTANVISKILHIPVSQAYQILEKYQYGTPYKSRNSRIEEPRVNIQPFKLPNPCQKLNIAGRRYLRNRGFNSKQLERDWNLLQTPPISYLDKIDYGNRIIVPIYWKGEMVSFQGRDITGRHNRKYLACPSYREKVKHSDIVYGHPDTLGYTDTLILVEGVFDVWRLGKMAVCTFGTSLKLPQILNLKPLANNFIILYDAEKTAQEQARQLSVKLKALGKRTRIVTLDEGDPADLKQDEADRLVTELLEDQNP